MGCSSFDGYYLGYYVGFCGYVGLLGFVVVDDTFGVVFLNLLKPLISMF